MMNTNQNDVENTFMKTSDILTILQKKIHTVIMATIDEHHHLMTCAIDLMLYEDDTLYFLTARGKSFYERLMAHPYVALTGLKGEDTLSSVAISLQGKVKNIRHEKLKEIFEENEYMKDIYPNEEVRDVLEVFRFEDYQGEYFDLSQKPLIRIPFSYQRSLPKGRYQVLDNCIGCLKCYDVCPQKCIDITQTPVKIIQKHCLHCAKCVEVCFQQAIVRI